MIELKRVSFTYQGQEHDGLRDIDLTIAGFLLTTVVYVLLVFPLFFFFIQLGGRL
mgnify:CR=1 FL=1